MDLNATQLLQPNSLLDEDVEGVGEVDDKSKPVAFLQVLENKHVEKCVHPLFNGENVIGRDKSSSVCIKSQTLSKQHAIISIKNGGGCCIYDVGSLNKTKKSNCVLKPGIRYELHHGDVIVFADIECRFTLPEAKTNADSNSENSSDSVACKPTTEPPEKENSDDDSTAQESHINNNLSFDQSQYDFHSNGISCATQKQIVEDSLQEAPSEGENEAEEDCSAVIMETPAPVRHKEHLDLSSVGEVDPFVILSKDDGTVEPEGNPSVDEDNNLEEQTDQSNDSVEKPNVEAEEEEEQTDRSNDDEVEKPIEDQDDDDDDEEEEEEQTDRSNDGAIEKPIVNRDEEEEPTDQSNDSVAEKPNDDRDDDEEETTNQSDEGVTEKPTAVACESQFEKEGEDDRDNSFMLSELDEESKKSEPQENGESKASDLESQQSQPVADDEENEAFEEKDEIQNDLNKDTTDEILPESEQISDKTEEKKVEEGDTAQQIQHSDVTGEDAEKKKVDADDDEEEEEEEEEKEKEEKAIETKQSDSIEEGVRSTTPVDEIKIDTKKEKEKASEEVDEKLHSMKVVVDLQDCIACGLFVLTNGVVVLEKSPEKKTEARKRSRSRPRVDSKKRPSSSTTRKRSTDSRSRKRPSSPPNKKSSSPIAKKKLRMDVSVSKTPQTKKDNSSTVKKTPVTASRSVKGSDREKTPRKRSIAIEEKSESVAKTRRISAEPIETPMQPVRQTRSTRSQAANNPASAKKDEVKPQRPIKKAPPQRSKTQKSLKRPVEIKQEESDEEDRDDVVSNPKIMFTCFSDKKITTIIHSLGGSVVDSIDDCTHLISDKVRRTVKLLCTLSKGLPIVTLDWIYASQKKGHFIDPWPFLVEDSHMEKLYKFSLIDSLKKASIKPLFKSYGVYVTESVLPGPDEMKKIIESGGGQFLTKLPLSGNKKSTVIIISCPEDLPLCSRAIKNKVKVVDKEIVLTGVLRQDFDVNQYLLTSL